MRYIYLYLHTAIGVFLLSLFSSCSSRSNEKMFVDEAEEQNRLCPVMIDNYTRIDSIHYTATDNAFHYYYTLTGDGDNSLIANQMRERLQEQISVEVKESVGLSIHRKSRVTMEYIYFSEKNNDELFRVVVTPDMYR